MTPEFLAANARALVLTNTNVLRPPKGCAPTSTALTQAVALDPIPSRGALSEFQFAFGH